jgi:hypothetical protein
MVLWNISKDLSPQINLASGEPSKSLVSMFASVIIPLSLFIRMCALQP